MYAARSLVIRPNMPLLSAVPLVCVWFQPDAELGSFQISIEPTHPVGRAPAKNVVVPG